MKLDIKFSGEFIALSKKELTTKTSIVQRGSREATTYLLIPKEMRKLIKKNKSAKCGVVEGERNKKYLVVALK